MVYLYEDKEIHVLQMYVAMDVADCDAHPAIVRKANNRDSLLYFLHWMC